MHPAPPVEQCGDMKSAVPIRGLRGIGWLPNLHVLRRVHFVLVLLWSTTIRAVLRLAGCTWGSDMQLFGKHEACHLCTGGSKLHYTHSSHSTRRENLAAHRQQGSAYSEFTECTVEEGILDTHCADVQQLCETVVSQLGSALHPCSHVD